MAHRGERVISRKAIAQGMSDVLRFTCMLVRALSVHIAHKIAGAARIRHSLRPLFSRGRENNLQTSGVSRREIAKLRPRHCEERLRRSNPHFLAARWIASLRSQ